MTHSWPFEPGSIPPGEFYRGSTRVDGVDAAELLRGEAVVTLEDGSEAIYRIEGVYITAGDGTILGGPDGPDLARLAVCSCCMIELRPALERGLINLATAVIKSAHHHGLIRRSDSGIPLCPRHQVWIETVRGMQLLTPAEAEARAELAIIDAPVQWLVRLLLKREDQ